MEVKHKYSIHLDRRQSDVFIDAVQGDSRTRVLEFTLYSGGQKWDVPEGADVWIGYCGDGGKGMYSKLSEAEDAEPAYSVDGNVVTVTLIPQVTAVAGYTELNVMFRNEDTKQQIATFSVTIRVARNPATGAGKPEDYYDIRQWVEAGPLIVTVTKNNDGTYSADKTHSAIITAVSANREVICRRSSLVMTAQRVSNNVARFIADDEGVQYVLEIDSDNVITFTGNTCVYQSDLDGYAKSSELSDYAKTDELKSYAKKTDLNGYAKSSDLDGYAKTSDVKNTIFVTITDKAGGGYTSSHTFYQLLNIVSANNDVACRYSSLVMPLQRAKNSAMYFQSVVGNQYFNITIDSSNNITFTIDYYEHAKLDTDEKYFDIDFDGVISLKPEYQANGSKATSLPERITIPDNIGGEQVSGFQVGMFKDHQRIKSVVLPPSATKIPNEMFHKAIYLERVENTEQIQEIGENAFSWTRIRDIRLPNLTCAGASAFENCSCLTTIDVGKVTSIAEGVFRHCQNLSEVLGGSNVTTIGQEAFFATRRLKTLPFLANLKDIGTGAFYSSRCDFEDVYDTLVANGCSFGEYSMYKKYNDVDYWSSVKAFTPCKTPLNSLFHQKNPLWKDKVITDEITETDGSSSTYGKTGCAFISLAEVYSAFEGVTYNSPVEFANFLDGKGLLGANYNFRWPDGWRAIAEALGYHTEFIDIMSSDGLKAVYAALANGALVYRTTGVRYFDANNNPSYYPGSGHATLWYGVNSDGEFLVSDTSMHCDEVGIYENHKSAWHTCNTGSIDCNTIIVWKGEKTW